MTKAELVNVIVILLDMDDSAKSSFSKLDLPVLKVMYEKMLANAKHIGFQKELYDEAQSNVRTLTLRVKNLEAKLKDK